MITERMMAEEGHRVLRDRTSMFKATPHSSDQANKDISITRDSLRVRDHKKTRHTQHHVQDKTSMPKATPLSQDRDSKDIAITRDSLRVRYKKRTLPPRHHVKDNKTSMPKASTLSPDKAKNDISITRGSRRIRSIRQVYASSPSSNVTATKQALVRPPLSQSPYNMTAIKLADIDVTSVGDRKICRITGSAVMTDNRLIIADDHNNKLKLINTLANQLMATLDVVRRRYVTEMYLHQAARISTRPWDVAAINNHQAVVTVPDNKTILVVQVTDTLVAEREITVSGLCMGVAYSQDRLLVTYSGTPRLEILDMRGGVIRTIEHDSDGGNLFLNPLYVCVSNDGETVYVSDYARYSLTSLTLDGVVKAIYEDTGCIFPGKVCSDRHGNVYVCRVAGRSVYMLTADCIKVKVILTEADGLDSYVWSVSHCQDTDSLFIGMESNTLKSYQLV